MKVCRFLLDGAFHWGQVEGDLVFPCRGDLYEGLEPTGEPLRLEQLPLQAPVLPGKIIGIGRNYEAHASELGNVPPDSEPIIFLKAPTSLLAPGAAIRIPGASRRVDYEGEIGVVVGRTARRIRDDEDPLSYVLGYTCVNDVTARDLQKKDVQFTRAKGFDTFCPCGPWIETDLDPARLQILTRVNGQLRQNGNSADMIFPVPHILRFLSGIMTLLPGDLIATGTPAGVGPMQPGDWVEVEVEGIGTLRNPCLGDTEG